MELPKRGEVVPMAKIKEICEYYRLDELWAKIEEDPPAHPFTSDGCSLWVDCWKGTDIYPACFIHDLQYWAGRENEDLERFIADSLLMIEVAKRTKDLTLAQTMFLGVRLGGHEILKQTFSWGFGRRKLP